MRKIVEPVTAVLPGIALVKQATSFIKDNINTVNDISGIAQQIDHLFEGQQAVDKQRSKDSRTSIGDQLGVKSVAQSVIDSKLAQEELYNISLLIDHRFGYGTWKTILLERKKRIEAHKEHLRKVRAVKLKKKQELFSLLTQVSIGIGTIILVTGLAIVIFVLNSCTFSPVFGDDVKEPEAVTVNYYSECKDFFPEYFMICLNEGSDRARQQAKTDWLERERTIIRNQENKNE